MLLSSNFLYIECIIYLYLGLHNVKVALGKSNNTSARSIPIAYSKSNSPRDQNIDPHTLLLNNNIEHQEQQQQHNSLLQFSHLQQMESSMITLAGVDIGVGHVISLHNGHNGWPTPREIQSLRQLIEDAGFNIQ